MEELRRLTRTTLFGGVLFLIPLVFVVVFFGKAFQIMKVVATPVGKLIPVESIAGFAMVEILTAFITIVSCLLAGMLARSSWGKKVSQKLDSVLLQGSQVKLTEPAPAVVMASVAGLLSFS